jgi:hypothetical protein
MVLSLRNVSLFISFFLYLSCVPFFDSVNAGPYPAYYCAAQTGGYQSYNTYQRSSFAKNTATSCPASVNTAAVAAPCRQVIY